jgi:glycerophosphoryl diester phosphodiesterase
MPAFRRALEHAEGFEFDVRMTADGRLVTMHDGRFKVGDATFPLRELSYRELIRLHPLGRLVPTVKRALSLKPSVVNADLKELDALIPLLRTLERTNYTERAVISVDEPAWVPLIKRECPDCRVGLSVTGFGTLMRALRTRVYSIHVPLDLIRYSGARGFEAFLRAYGRRARVWLWNYRMDEVMLVPRFLGLVDAVISDDPARLKRFLGRRAI